MSSVLTSWPMLVLLLWWPVQNLALAFFAWRTPRRPSTATAASDRTTQLQFWIIIPALNEERVIERTVRSALELGDADTPVRVLVVDDGSDDSTARVVSGIDHPHLHVMRREAPYARQGKGEALNAGYRYVAGVARSEQTRMQTVVGVIDGDGRGSDGLLREVAALLRERGVGAVQCRVRIHNRRKLLGLLQDLEFGVVADASQSLRDLLGSVGMGGNGQFTRLPVLEKFHPSPWTDCLVEDLELGLRLHLAGIRIRYTQRAWVTQQGLEDIRRLLRQRTRWAQGNLQCARHLRALAVSKFVAGAGLLDFLVYLVMPWLTVPASLFSAALAVLVPVTLLTGGTMGGLVAAASAAPLAAGLWLAALVAPGLMWALVFWIRRRDEPLRRAALAGLAYPGFLLLGVAATWRAVFRIATRRNKWTKTERLAESGPEQATLTP
ncbi:N-acetyl-glucosamine transferase [Amycolatopsis sp. A1MSW2902]|uniref:glycosyltransferase family 2 protein n=1 Tax=Amycolatopsis sp. A1MSW2902 TaxID=687413 RepID=UPI00307FA632